jgi:hypothetical protein
MLVFGVNPALTAQKGGGGNIPTPARWPHEAGAAHREVRIQVRDSRVQGFRVQGFKGSGFKVQGSRVQGSGFKVQGSRFEEAGAAHREVL